MIDRSLLFAGWLVVTVAAIKVLPVSGLVYTPEEVAIEGETVTLQRFFPLDVLGYPRPTLSYVETVRPLTPTHNGGHSCTDAGGPFPYNRETEFGVWEIPWAADCLSDPLGFEWVARWYWHIGGLRVGPVSLEKTFLKPKHSK